MKTIHFNTGRLYQPDGQKITATLHDDGVVTFFDHSRTVIGEFPLGEHATFNEACVMDSYDNGLHRGTVRAWQDGTVAGECNSVWVQP